MVIMIEKVAEHRRTHNHDLNPCQVPMADDNDDDGNVYSYGNYDDGDDNDNGDGNGLW